MNFKIKSSVTNTTKKEESLTESSNGTTFKLPHQMTASVVMFCKCIQSTNGDYNLDGYIINKKYKVQYMGVGKHGKAYVRLYKEYDIDKEDSNTVDNCNSYDTITVFNYQYYFTTFGIDENRGKPDGRSKRK